MCVWERVWCVYGKECILLLCVYGSECRVWERVCVGVTVVCLWERMLRVSLRFEDGCCVFMAEHVVCV